MGQELKLTSKIPPSVNHYLGHRAILKNGRPMSVDYCTQEAKRYKKEFAAYVAAEAAGQGWTNLGRQQHIYADAVFYFPRVDMDSNNYWKCMLDAITDSGAVWDDDNIVCERTMGIYYNGSDPHVELTIHPVGYTGIFGDISQLEAFEANCVGCRRYTRNCSLLAKAKAGQVQEEISGGVCLSYKEKG